MNYCRGEDAYVEPTNPFYTKFENKDKDENKNAKQRAVDSVDQFGDNALSTPLKAFSAC